VYHALVATGAERNLLPLPLVDRVRRHSLEQLRREIDVPLLLVRLDEPDGELAQALGATTDAGAARVEPGMSFNTVSTDRRPARPASIPPPASFAPEQILVRVVRVLHFIVPIGKRADAGRVFSERVTVGRARNSDVVLRHESVSKFHAWFARDEDSVYFLSDANSRNGTWRNGSRLSGGYTPRITTGDLLRFGNVEATYCDVATLHAALHA
jgi:hypothetical protein